MECSFLLLARNFKLDVLYYDLRCLETVSSFINDMDAFFKLIIFVEVNTPLVCSLATERNFGL